MQKGFWVVCHQIVHIITAYKLSSLPLMGDTNKKERTAVTNNLHYQERLEESTNL